jgi:hypothetical protein
VKHRVEPADVLMPPKFAAAPRSVSPSVVISPVPQVLTLTCSPAATVQSSQDLQSWNDFGEVSNTVISTGQPQQFFRVKPASVMLAWMPSPSSDVTGYRVYTGGQSRVYSQTNTVGMTTNYTVEIESPAPVVYFSCTCFTASGEESDFSNEATVEMAAVVLHINK